MRASECVKRERERKRTDLFRCSLQLYMTLGRSSNLPSGLVYMQTRLGRKINSCRLHLHGIERLRKCALSLPLPGFIKRTTLNAQASK